MASYYALRRCSGAASDAWWLTVSARRDAPSPILALVSGRERIEVSHAETVESLAWAEQIDGWEPALRVHPHDPRVNDQ